MQSNSRKVVTTLTAEEVEALPPAARRVLIARDALDLLNEPFVYAAPGAYIGCIVPDDTPPETQFNAVVEGWLAATDPSTGGPAACTVCAIGAVLLSTVRRFDDLKLGELRSPSGDYALRGFGSRGAYVRYLKRFFDEAQLNLIEAAFEHDDISYSMPYEEKERANRFYDNYTSSRRRAAAILQNIIDNNGTFIP